MFRSLTKRLKKRFGKKSAADLAKQQFLSIRFPRNEIALDCGAHVGIYTKQLARQGAIVYAFVPNPYAFVETHDVLGEAVKDQAAEIRSLIEEKQLTNINLDWR